ncbi:hypothetical protein AJ87_28980 [Rhizobium yanglingense]|nr:hypothetical protein AJ87_28980 [Rhizobium yanglingense]
MRLRRSGQVREGQFLRLRCGQEVRWRWRAIRGRTINEAHAEVVRRIFRDYAAGKSAKIIAFALNKEGNPAPTGHDWGFSTINDKPRDASTAARISVTGSAADAA